MLHNGASYRLARSLVLIADMCYVMQSNSCEYDLDVLVMAKGLNFITMIMITSSVFAICVFYLLHVAINYSASIPCTHPASCHSRCPPVQSAAAVRDRHSRRRPRHGAIKIDCFTMCNSCDHMISIRRMMNSK